VDVETKGKGGSQGKKSALQFPFILRHAGNDPYHPGKETESGQEKAPSKALSMTLLGFSNGSSGLAASAATGW
jgi:hypothetical protein